MIIPLILSFLLVLGPTAQDEIIPPLPKGVPRSIKRTFIESGLDKRYKMVFRLYPYYFRGDFNGDRLRDIAVQVQDRVSKKLGIAIIHQRKPQALSTHLSILGAGTPLGEGSDHLDWVEVWNSIRPSKVVAMVQDSTLPKFSGDVLMLEKRGEKKGLVYWQGGKYRWRILGGR